MRGVGISIICVLLAGPDGPPQVRDVPVLAKRCRLYDLDLFPRSLIDHDLFVLRRSIQIASTTK